MQRIVLLLALLTMGAGLLAPAHAQAQRRAPADRAEITMSFAPIVKRVAPAVVNVYATTVSAAQPNPFANDPFFRQFFGPNGPFGLPQRPQKSQSLGSGVIVDPSGVILTNAHVVAGATDIRISLSDGREFAVDLLLEDTRTDLAVLKVRNARRQQFAALEYGDPDALEVGDLVLAIGNPFGVGQTVTSGIVSGLARTGVEISDLGFFIQTDAAINPGNSGGALVDMSGRLIGINSAILSRAGGSIGIGFAIPATMAQVVAEAALEGGQIERPYFGAEVQPVNADLARSLGLDVPRGALVTALDPQSPAADAGLRVGDLVVAIDGIEISDPGALRYRLAVKRVGEVARLDFLRDGRPRTTRLNLIAGESAATAPRLTVSGNTRFAGATAAMLTPSLAQELGLPFEARGIAIVDVAAGSPAQRLGLQKGDIILSLNGEAIDTLKRFETLVTRQARGWQIELQRGNRVIRSFVNG